LGKPCTVGDSFFAMSEHDEDIDFDFFGEPEAEPPKKQRLVRRPSGPPPGGPPPPRRPAGPAQPATPVVRLVSLVGFAIAAILILIFAVRSCESSNETAAYKEYMGKVGTIATDSQSIGKRLTTLLASQGLQEKTLESKLVGMISQQKTDLQKASQLTPPGPLRQQQDRMVEALQLRDLALTGLLSVFRSTATKKGTDTETARVGELLSNEMQRGVASDVVWSDLFESTARSVMQKEGIAGVAPPSSVFIADPELASRNTMSMTWQVIHGVQVSGTTTGGRHGTGITYVKVGTKTLVSGETATIKVNGALVFAVGVQNSGDYMEQNVKVTLLINQKPDPIKIQKTIDKIYNGTTQEVDFKVGGGTRYNLQQFVQVVTVKVDIAPVTGETYLGNNKATYEVIFSL
jgi:hypothetical protein